jgi:hypothetical protein
VGIVPSAKTIGQVDRHSVYAEAGLIHVNAGELSRVLPVTLPPPSAPVQCNNIQLHLGPPAMAAASVDEPLPNQPFLDHVGDGCVVLLHHHEMRIAPDADLREVDDLDAAAGGLGKRRHLDVVLALP